MTQSAMCTDLIVTPVVGDKSRYMPLLLMGDESADMIGRYIGRADLYVGSVGGHTVAVCAVMNDDREYMAEIKNLAVHPDWRCRGVGRMMLRHVEKISRHDTFILGTGETPSTLRFYKSCGYEYSHRILDFFTDNYPDPIVEEGVMLRDMIYLVKRRASKHQLKDITEHMR